MHPHATNVQQFRKNRFPNISTHIAPLLSEMRLLVKKKSWGEPLVFLGCTDQPLLTNNTGSSYRK